MPGRVRFAAGKLDVRQPLPGRNLPEIAEGLVYLNGFVNHAAQVFIVFWPVS